MSGKPKKEYVILTEDEIYNIQYMIREQRKLCGDCADFRLHYTKWSKNEYWVLQYGHCGKRRFKHIFVQDEACSYWREKDADELLQGFLNKFCQNHL